MVTLTADEEVSATILAEKFGRGLLSFEQYHRALSKLYNY